MSKIKVLNLYAGIGGNRKLWENVEVTAVENHPGIMQAYKDHYPEDNIICGDAHEYLLQNYDKFDFIWSSPPCQSHGQYRYNVGVRAKGYKALYPDMKLYEEILLLKHYFNGQWIVENVKPYYEPLIEPSFILQRHLFWSNYNVENIETEAKGIRTKNKISDYDYMGIDLTGYKIENKRQVFRNCVEPEIGRHIFDSASFT